MRHRRYVLADGDREYRGDAVPWGHRDEARKRYGALLWD